MSKGLSVEVQGAKEVLAKYSVIGATALKQGLNRLGISLLNKATLVSPVKSGRTRGSLKKGAAGNIWIESSKGLLIGSSVKSAGVYYPTVLDEGGDRYHYRDGPFEGQPLGDWFTGIASRSESDVKAALDAAKQELLKKWGR